MIGCVMFLCVDRTFYEVRGILVFLELFGLSFQIREAMFSI